MRQPYFGFDPFDASSPPWCRIALERNLWEKVDQSAGPAACWLWLGAIKRNLQGTHPYGILKIDRKAVAVHRIIYWLHHGRWPAPLTRHTCHETLCCNPLHLLEGTPQQNTQDAVDAGRVTTSDACSCGQPWSQTAGGVRVCRVCRYRRLKAWRARHPERARKLDRESKRRQRRQR